MNGLNVSTSSFTGPFDLLLSLIERREIDICSISIFEITDEYLQYVTTVEWPDLEEAASFLLIAATLLYIKSKSLLPAHKTESEDTEEDAIDTEIELLNKIIEYKKFKNASLSFKDLIEKESLRFARFTIDEPSKRKLIGNPLEGIGVDNLLDYVKIALKSDEAEISAIPKISIPVAEKIAEIISQLKLKKRLGFSELLDPVDNHRSAVASLLALTQMIKDGKARANQIGLFSEIWILRPKTEEEVI